MIRDIVALIDGAPDKSGVGECALALAGELTARLTLLGAPRDLGVTMHLAQAPARALADALHRSHGVAETRAIELEERARAAAITCVRRSIYAPALDYPGLLERTARLFDLCVIGIPGSDSHLEDTQLFEAALFRTGRPTLAVPRGFNGATHFARIMVAWDGGREAARALGDAMPFLHHASAVEVVTIAANGAGSDDATHSDLCAHLALHGVACEVVRIEARGRKAEPLLARARETAADLVVVGASRHARWRQAMLGDTMRDMTQETHVPLLLSG
jgi:nucleotide-binding universal stress UspA family protein